jgi:hypothetical protein
MADVHARSERDGRTLAYPSRDTKRIASNQWFVWRMGTAASGTRRGRLANVARDIPAFTSGILSNRALP